MAQEFCEWLQTAIERYTHVLDKPILIVGVTGKSDLNGEKYSLIDQLLDYSVFCGRYKEDSLISVINFLFKIQKLFFKF